ncbi:MAG TPA: hypothetical protein VGA49_00025 [Patescibacteria group bacterium]
MFRNKKIILKILSVFFLVFVFGILLSGLVLAQETASIKLNVPFGGLGTASNYAEYIAALYKFGVAAAGVVAVVMIMIGGIIWIVAAGNASKIGQAQNLITNAIIGLIMILGSYVLLNTINPDLVKLRVPELETIIGKRTASTVNKCCVSESTGKEPFYNLRADNCLPDEMLLTRTLPCIDFAKGPSDCAYPDLEKPGEEKCEKLSYNECQAKNGTFFDCTNKYYVALCQVGYEVPEKGCWCGLKAGKAAPNKVISGYCCGSQEGEFWQTVPCSQALTKQPEGEVCGENPDCMDGLICNTGDKRCAKLGTENAFCGTDPDCGGGLVCHRNNRVCVNRCAAKGESCSRGSSAQSYDICCEANSVDPNVYIECAGGSGTVWGICVLRR